MAIRAPDGANNIAALPRMSYCLHFSVTLSRTNILENNAYIMALPLYHFIFYSTLISGSSIDQPSGKCLRQNGDQLNTHIHQSQRRHTHQFQNTLPAINQQKTSVWPNVSFMILHFPVMRFPITQ